MNKELNRVLNAASEFIKSLDCEEGFPGCKTPGKFAFRENEGFLNLSGKDLNRYNKTLSEIIKCVDNDTLSQKAIDTYFLDAIFYTLDINKNRQEISFKKRLSQAIIKLEEKILQEPILFNIYYPIFGASNSGLPTNIGNVSFDIFSEEYKKLFLEGLELSRDGNQKDWFTDYVNSGQINDKVTAFVEIPAVDNEAAKYSALKEINFTKNIINFFVDLIPYNSGYLFLPGEKDRLVINVPVIKREEKPIRTFGSEVVGPLSPFSFKDLFEAFNKNNIEFERINTLLIKENKTHFETRLLSAISWAGKAVGLSKNNKELAFLFYAISLETIILLENKREEITKRLKTRIAKLIAKDDKKSKGTVERKVTALYNTRSEIVHDGKFEVSDVDLAYIKYIARNCIYAILCDVNLNSLNTAEEFLKWFNNPSTI